MVLKWSSSVLGNNGKIYGIPYKANPVLQFDPITNEFVLIGKEWCSRWQWCNGCLGTDGNIYGVPQDSHYVLKITIANRWDVWKRHILLRRLVERKRAFAIRSSDNESIVRSCYRHFVQCSDDDVFRSILRFL